MKKLFTFLFLFNIAFAQDTWVRLQIQLDQWSEESSWTMYDSNGDIAFEMFDDYWDYPNQLIDLYMEMDSGDYTFEFTDSYGDGFYPSGYVLLTNECQDTLAYAFDLGNDTANGWTFPGVFDQSPAMLLESLTIAPCAPPVTFTYGCVNPVAMNYDSSAESSWMESCQYVYGCTNSNALNFDPNATYDDGSCTFPAPQFDTSNVYQSCNGAQTELTFEYQANGYGPTTNVNQVHYGYDLSATPFVQSQFFQGGVPVGATPPVTFPYTIWEVTYFANTLNQIALKAGGNFVTEEIPHFFFVKFNDGTYSDTLWITPEACIVGCMDETSPLYNPMATIDDGSCNVIAACGPNETNISIMVTPDSYPGETSWEIVDTLTENVIATSPNYNQTGIPVTTSICIDTTMALEFRLLDQFGDGLCGSCYGGVDGEVLVINPLCGDTIFYLAAPNTNFGYEIEQNFTLSFCPPPSPLSGCTDPGYVEFDPMAVIDDSSCVTPVILGCIDSTMFNYDSLANQQQIIPGCDYTLKLTDGPGDGWFGSYIALVQGGNTYGPYTIQDGFVLDTVLSLSAIEPVKIYFYTQGNSITTANQCGIQLIDPFGNVTFDIGGSPWSPILTYPFKYTTLLDCGNNCIEKVYGCIDPLAVNYDSSANTADGSCYYNPGCTNPIYLEYDASYDYDDGSCSTLIVLGCMDSTAYNYDSLANVELDGSCIPYVYGCMDPLMFNYDPLATAPDLCVPYYYGCTDPIAFNYDPVANTDNGNCIPVIFGCTDSTAFNFDPLANTDNSSCVAIVEGCTNPLAINYDVNANVDNFSCILPIYGCTDSTAFNYDELANVDNGNCIDVVEGCTNPIALNYDANANTDDFSCILPIYGCMDSTAFNYDELANVDNGTCIPFIYGCTNPIALNYCDTCNTDDFSCVLPIYGCTDSTMFNYNPLANVDNGSCVAFVYGCTDPNALNYNSLANVEDFSCIDYVYGCTDSTMFNYNPNANTDNGSCLPFVYGCTDADAINYDILANTDDGTCIDVVLGCTDSTAFNYDILANTDDGSCIPVVWGCTDGTAFNFNSSANTDDGSCIPVVFGCIDPTMWNYCDTCNTDNGNCIPYYYGCTDSTALNYDDDANTDNGSCIYPLPGCTDPTAINYNIDANVADSSCYYSAGCNVGDIYYIPNECFEWVISVDPYCCDNEWDETCSGLYDYCVDGWSGPTSVQNITIRDFSLYPNPTNGFVNLTKTVDVEVYNILGDKIISMENTNTIDMTYYEAGVYTVTVTYQNIIVNYKLIKQ